jgi:hypothetical protein
LGLVIAALPAILPYVLSGSYAWRLVSERRLGLSLFLTVSIVGAVVANLIVTGSFDLRVTTSTIFWYVLGQIAVYGFAAEFLLTIEWP